MQIKITERSYQSVRMCIIKKRMWRKGNTPTLLVRILIVTTTMKNTVEIP